MAITLINTLRSEIYLASKIWAPIVEQVRYTNRPNLQRPLPLHYKRKRMLEVCKPRYREAASPCEKMLMPQFPHDKQEMHKDNPFAEFLAKKMKKSFDNSPLIAIFHRNSYTQHEFLKFRGHLFDAKFDMRIDQWINSNVAQKALQDTKWAPALQLIGSYTVIGYSKSTNIEKLNKVLRKMPALVLLGVITQNRLMNRVDAEAFSKIPSIEAVRSQLCHTLNQASINVHRTLEANQVALSNSLTTYSSPPSTTETNGDNSNGTLNEKQQ